MKETFYDEKYQSLTFGRYGKTVVNTGPTYLEFADFAV